MQSLRPSGALRVLVVDEDVDAADTLALALRFWGHESLTAYDAHSALELARTHHPAAVLLDLGLKRMDPYELARRLRRIEGMESVLLVAIADHPEEPPFQETRAARIDALLTRPFDPRILEQILATGPGTFPG